MKVDLNSGDGFEKRHIGPDEAEQQQMLSSIGAKNIEELISQTIPGNIRIKKDLNIPEALTEFQFLEKFRAKAGKNKIHRSFIGQGYYGCIVPPVIQRNILENPGWYTAYTPYQAEIAQGRLEALINFQTMTSDLTGMEISNASLLDEGTAAAEGMAMLHALKKGSKKSAHKFLADENTFGQTKDVLKSRALPLGIDLRFKNITEEDLRDPEVYGILLQYPNCNGSVEDIEPLVSQAKQENVMVVVAADLLALTLLKPPGEMGADVVVGSSQRLGVPMGYGGPHAAFFATREDYKRQIPGRIIGVSVDKYGKKAYRMALQTREQHIKRERATSNICTSQVLLAVMAGMYAVYHGAEGLRKIAVKVSSLAQYLGEQLSNLGFPQKNRHYFDTLNISSQGKAEDIRQLAEQYEMNFWYPENGDIIIALDETHTLQDVYKIVELFSKVADTDPENESSQKIVWDWKPSFPENLVRRSSFLQHPVFNTHHSEHEMLRYMKKLENRDLSLAHSMIPLGSCTMKLNATAEMMPITWPELGNLHPFAPLSQAEGYKEITRELENWLSEITGFTATSLQPNSGAQGEYAGLMTISEYLKDKGEEHRNVTLIPSSAHGTNPASAVMAGMQVVIVNCDERGNINVNDLHEKAKKHKDRLAALMVTYPSTHGVFEERIVEICEIVHQYGGQVYMDGANMNAQVGLTSPAAIGADVCHLNLHKTFCIPHGGGGPGVGPICVAEHLKDYLPGNPYVKTGGEKAFTAVSSAPWGSAGILAISYAYIAMMGVKGLKKATEVAILNANYVLNRLKEEFPVLYAGKNGRCAHEMMVDCRPFKKLGVEVEDIAKRLMDYGFHAPTVSFPVPGTLMIEPTESETKDELDRFCDAMISIREEIREIERGIYDTENNVLKNAPHVQDIVVSDRWDFPYNREKAVYPLPYLKEQKFWPAVSRIDAAYGDRNLMCTCIPVTKYETEASML